MPLKMKPQFRHIITAYFLVAVFSLPMLWQLEHVFDNSHGIVYQTAKQNIQKKQADNCNLLHKQLLSVFWFESPVYKLLKPFQNYKIVITTHSDYHLSPYYSIQDRAPPVFELVENTLCHKACLCA